LLWKKVSVRIRIFPSTPPKPVNAPDECQGPFLPSPLVPSVISTPGRWQSTVGNTRSDQVCAGPRRVNSINFQSRICVSMPLTLSIGSSIGSKSGIYAAPAEIPPRPDGGLPGPTPFAPQTSLALPRWPHSEYAPPSPGNIIYPGARASNLYHSDLTGEITIAAKHIWQQHLCTCRSPRGM